MAEPQIRFDDGAGYERMMGKWSRLKPPAGLRWIDVGCGNGAFTELLAERCVPAEIQGVDPSEAQLAFARARHSAGIARFQKGDAMALPFADNSFDAAAMALVIFFVPEPPAALAEMARVVRPGTDRELCLGRRERRISQRAAAGRNARDGTSGDPAAERSRLAHGKHARAVGRRGPRSHRDARDHRAADV